MKFIDLYFAIFKFLCIVGTLVMVGYWLYKYSQNNDVTLIEFKSLEEISNLIYPELTLCIYNPFGKPFFEPLSVKEKRRFLPRYLRYLRGDYTITSLMQ